MKVLEIKSLINQIKNLNGIFLPAWSSPDKAEW
jgi:hypothetical protein